MHERSLIAALLKQVGRIQVEQGGGLVTEIAVEVGPLSGVEPALLKSAFDEMSAEFPNSMFIVNEVAITALCQVCGQTNTMDRFRSQCSKCHSVKLQITGGDTFRLLHVTLHEHLSGNITT
jgi:hydrogenase nickel incorporation protein HypA/HybF